MLATRYGLKAADLVDRRAASAGWPRCTATTIVDVSLEEATKELKTVPTEWYDVAKAFFG